MTTPGVDPGGTTPGGPVGPSGAAAGATAAGSGTSGWTTAPPRPPVEQPAYAAPRTYAPGATRTDSAPPPPARTAATVTPETRVRRRPGARKARLRLTRVDPWSALKTSLVFSGFLFIVWMVAVVVLYLVLVGAGTFDSINDFLSSVFGQQVDFNAAVILGGAAVIGALSVVLVSALGTVMAFAYNVTASILGGVEVTLTESEG